MRHSIVSGHPDQDRESPPHPGGRLHRRLQPWLLLLLLQKPSHGYELMERLSQNEDDAPFADVGLLYRTLRHLEEGGMVRSAWDTEGKGPARRLYQVTAEGAEYLEAWATDLRQLRKRLERFLAKYQAFSQAAKGAGLPRSPEAWSGKPRAKRSTSAPAPRTAPVDGIRAT